MNTRPTQLRRALALIALGGALFACDDEAKTPGEEGGNCRLSLTPCDDGLTCQDGVCAPALAADAQLEAKFLLQKSEVYADGTDRTVVAIDVVDLNTGKPFEGQVHVYCNPLSAGEVVPAVLDLDEAGHGVTQFTACKASAADCPLQARLMVAPTDAPLETCGISDRIALLRGERPDAGE